MDSNIPYGDTPTNKVEIMLRALDKVDIEVDKVLLVRGLWSSFKS
jgi:hypothetical protein